MKKKIKEICSDCYGNNPFIQNEGLQSYYNMLPKDDCGKCKDTPYPNPGQGNCCEEPDHSGIYTLGCIEGYGTKCDPLRIKENCLPSGSSDCDCEVELECTTTTCSFELPTFPPSVIYHYDLNIEDAVWTGDDATTARVVIKSGEEELLNIFYTGNFSCNDPCPNNYIQELLERVLQIYYGSIEGPTDYFTVILADNILLISSDTLKTFELSIIIGENTLDYTINNDSAFHTTTFSSEYVPAIELSESWSEFEDQYKLIWTINYTGEFQLSTTQNDITTVTHFTNISPVLSSGGCEDMTYELRHENILIDEGEMIKTEITETKSICEAIEEAKYCTRSIPGSCDYRVEGIDLGGEEKCEYSKDNIQNCVLDSMIVNFGLGSVTSTQSINVGLGFTVHGVDTEITLEGTTISFNDIKNAIDNFTSDQISITYTDEGIITLTRLKCNGYPIYFAINFNDESENENFIVTKPVTATHSFTQTLGMTGGPTGNYSYINILPILTLTFKVKIDGEWSIQTSNIVNGSWILGDKGTVATEWKIEDGNNNIIDSGPVDITCTAIIACDYFITDAPEGFEIYIVIDNSPIDISNEVVNGSWQELNSLRKITRWGFYDEATDFGEEYPIVSNCYNYNESTFEVNINGEWQDETDNVSENGTWVLVDTTDIVTEWRYKDSEGEPGESTPIIGDCTEPIEEKYSICEKLNDHEIRITELEENGGGGEVSASNGVYNDEGTIKLGGNITENTKLDNPNSKSVQIGSDGDAINLNVVPPFPYNGLISTYSGYDYTSAEYSSFIGVLKGLNFAPLGFSNQDMVGTFTIVGNPFDPINPDGQIFVDGLWYDDYEDEVAMNKIILNFSPTGVEFNSIIQAVLIQSQDINGDNGTQNQSITGDNANQRQNIYGNSANQYQDINGDSATQNQFITGDDAKQDQVIIGDNATQLHQIIGSNGEIITSIIDTSLGKQYLQNITATKQTIEVDTIELKADVEITKDVKLSGVTTGIPINTYGIDASGKVVKFNLADYLPKTLVEFRGLASYTGTTSESVVYASPAIPSTAWRENGNYILTVLGAVQAGQTQNAVIKIYLNTADTLNGSEILINQSHVLTDNAYTPNGGNVLAIHLPIFKNAIELLTNKGNSTIANINTGSIFSSNINMTYAKIRTKVTPNFTGNLYLIITTTQSVGSVTTAINNIIFKEI